MLALHDDLERLQMQMHDAWVDEFASQRYLEVVGAARGTSRQNVGLTMIAVIAAILSYLIFELVQVHRARGHEARMRELALSAVKAKDEFLAKMSRRAR